MFGIYLERLRQVLVDRCEEIQCKLRYVGKQIAAISTPAEFQSRKDMFQMLLNIGKVLPSRSAQHLFYQPLTHYHLDTQRHTNTASGVQH